jgi:hypothetical protein
MICARPMANLRQNTANGWAPRCVNEQIFKVEAPLRQFPVGMPAAVARRKKYVDLQSKELRIKEPFTVETANNVAAVFRL